MPIAIEPATTDELSQQFTQLLTMCSNSKNTDDRKVAADDLLQKINQTGTPVLTFNKYGLMDSIRTSYAQKKDAGAKEGALLVVASAAAAMGQAAMPYLISFIPMTLEGLADKQKNVARAAKMAFQSIFDVIVTIPNATRAMLPYLLSALPTEKAWQGKVVALNSLVVLSKTAKAFIDQSLPEIIPEISQCMWDSKSEVQKAAYGAMEAVCNTISNPDLLPFIPLLVRAIEQPSEVPETVHKLAATTFVTTVEAPSLAIMAPILHRGLSESSQAILRQTSIIIDNMCKLVEVPEHAEQFLPKLLPGLNRVIDTAADAELRNVAAKAKATLVRVGGGKTDIVVADAATKTRAAVAIIKTVIGQKHAEALKMFDEAVLAYIANFCTSLDEVRDYTDKSWAKLSPIVESMLEPAQAADILAALKAHFVNANAQRGAHMAEVDPSEGEELCNCEFSLAYGSMILLNNTRLRLTRGQRYGLCGPMQCGKSTLMRAISNGQLDGFPTADVLKTVFVEHNLQASDAQKSVLDFVVMDESFKGKDQQTIIDTLASVGFDTEKRGMSVSALSGGWKMKLELARAMLQNADILLLDEPTNHLDVTNVAWLTKYLNSLKNVTSVIVSHDSSFIDDVCSHIIHYEQRKLKTHKGNLSEFVKTHPEAKSYYTLRESPITFKLPEPGFLEGVKSKDRAILKMTNVGFQYPGTNKLTVTGVTIQCSLNSRIAVLGPNGAGKSTVIKVLTGETEPTIGELWKHPNLRVAYVAQHAFHHIEKHMDKTPNEYIRWRYQNGEDRELAAKITRQLTPEEEKRLEVPIVVDGEKRKIETIMGRRNAKRGFEYEVKWIGHPWDDNTWVAREKLEEMGLEKFLKIFDDKEAAREGLFQRPLTSANVQKHLQELGLDPEFSTHSRMSSLSGGQKVKVVLAAATWDNPHIIVLDEPTNYLDRDSLGALAQALKVFGGGVVMVSHHTEFTEELCTEKWVLAEGRLTRSGGAVTSANEKIEMTEQTEKVDAFGNITKVKSTKVLSRKDQKAKERRRALKIKNGEPLSSDEEDM